MKQNSQNTALLSTASALLSVQSELASARAESAELRRDKERLDWLEKQFGIVILRGVMRDTETPVYDIHEPRDEGLDDACGEELGSGPNLRAAIDAAFPR